jgi:prevent-host-death family protein
MITVGASEAKTKLSELLDCVERGETVLITRHGKPVARLVAGDHALAASDQALAGQQAAQIKTEFSRIRESLRADGIGFAREEIAALRDEGRR